MGEIIVTIAIEVVKCVAKCIAPSAERRISYLLDYKSNFENLKAEVENLKCRRTSIQHEVDAAKNNVEEIEENVQKWLERAEEIEENFQKWLERASKIIPFDAAAERTGDDEQTAGKKRCFKGLCPDLKTRYQLSKEAVTLLVTVDRHLKAWTFDRISYPVILKDPRLSVKDYETFESRASTLTSVISSLSDSDVNVAGIYGMGGIGKTTLAKQVANHPETKTLFDSVIFVEVTQNPDRMKIQGEIAEKLGLRLSQEESESTRAGKLYQRLKSEKKILLILDNIWAYLDLKAVGIPLGDGHKGCKLLLTARNVDVLSGKMGSQRNFQVRLLDDDEVWILFKKMTGEFIEGREFKSIATEVAKKCARLPIVIVTIARALANKQLFVWKDALQQMRMSSSENVQDIHASIELSFKYLESDVLRKTILLIRYANLTSMDELVLYGMGLGLFEGINKMEGINVRVQTLIQQLKDSCLLLDSHTTDEDFSMHDIVRDVVMSIASRERLVFANELSHELDWLDENTTKVCPSIVLQDIKTGELPRVLERQQLKLLSISAARLEPETDSESDSYFASTFKIYDEFFARLTELKVLVLANMDLSSLPSSLCFLTNLRALGLYNCKLDDIALIGDLKKLKILSLKKSTLKKLPVEIGHLTQLKSLDLRRCFRIRIIPPNVISSLPNLEELYVGDFVQWGEEGLNKDKKNASLDELKHLSNLTCLEMQIKDAETLPGDLFFEKLKRYKIVIRSLRDLDYGESDRDWIWDFTSPKGCRKFKLSLVNTNICLKERHIMQLKEIEDLCLVGLQDMKSILYGLDRDGFPQLKYLQVQGNDNLLCIIDWMELESFTRNVFPVLESLLIRNLVNLKKICRGQVSTESFSQLRKIKVERCDKLENIFSHSIASRLQQLQSIDVINCEKMEEIFAIERQDESSGISEVIDDIELSQLRSLKLCSLRQLRNFCSELKPSTSQQRQSEITLEDDANISGTLFTRKVALPNLEVLEIYEINAEQIWQKQVVAISSSFQNLTKLIVGGCNNLRCLFSSSMVYSFVQLQQLEIFNCQILEVIFGTEDPTFESPKSTLSFQKLKTVIIDGCDRLKYVFPASIANSLSQLESLYIISCGVEEIVFVAEKGAKTNHRFVFPRVISLALYNLPNFTTFFPATYTMEWPALKDLKVLNFSLEESYKEGQTQFLVEKVFPNLEELTVRGKSIGMMWQFPIDLFSKLRFLDILFDEPIASLSFDFLQRFQSMRTLKLIGHPDEKDSKLGNGMLVLIRNLYVCSDLKQIWKEDTNMDHLVHLRIRSCHNLINYLVPSSTSFRNLTTLELCYCEATSNIMTSSTAKSLVRLRQMTILGCDLITEVVSADEGDEAKDYEIVFSELKELHLSYLESLMSFCSSANYTLNFPSLEELMVTECPNMKSFCGGKLRTPKLQRVKHEYWRDKVEYYWKKDLNTTIQELYEETCEKLRLLMTEIGDDEENY